MFQHREETSCRMRFGNTVKEPVDSVWAGGRNVSFPPEPWILGCKVLAKVWNRRQKSSTSVCDDKKSPLGPLEKSSASLSEFQIPRRQKNKLPTISSTLSTLSAPTKTVSNNLLVFLLNCTQWDEVAAVFKEALRVTGSSVLRWSCSGSSRRRCCSSPPSLVIFGPSGPPPASAGRRVRPPRSAPRHRVGRSVQDVSSSSITSSAPRSPPCSGRAAPGSSAPPCSQCRRRRRPPPACRQPANGH